MKGAQRTSPVQLNDWTFCCSGNDLKPAVPKEHFENSSRKNTCKIPEISHKYEEVAEGKPALQFRGMSSAKPA